jgi:hypothetical protein
LLAGNEAVKVNNSKFANLPNFSQELAMVAAKSGSGVRARWVELPDCNNEGSLAAGEVALKDDLSNAVIATCKSYGVSNDRYGRLTMGEPTSLAIDAENRAIERATWEALGKDSYDRRPIYDPVMHEEGYWRIPSHEHQVTQQQNGTVEATFEIPDSPNGDFQALTGSGFKYSEEEWEDLLPLSPVTAEASTVNYYEKVYPYSAYDNSTLVQFVDDVPEIVAEALHAQTNPALPDCTGDPDEVPLETDHTALGVEHMSALTPSTVATCKNP